MESFSDSESDKERFSAAISVAQTLIDLHAFDDALEWLERALFFEVKLGRPEVKVRSLLFRWFSEYSQVSSSCKPGCSCSRRKLVEKVQTEVRLVRNMIPSTLRSQTIVYR